MRSPWNANPWLMSISSPSESICQSPAIPELLQGGLDGRVELAPLGHLLAQRGGEPFHLLLERLAVGLLRLSANVAAGREDVVVFADLLQRRALAEASDVFVLPRVLLPAPGVVGAGDAGDLVIRQLAVGA